MAMTRAQSNKAIRVTALREQLATQGHVQHVIDMCDEIRQLSYSGMEEEQQARETDNAEEKAMLIAVAEKKVDIAGKRAAILSRAIAGKNALISKYMGDIKQQDVTFVDETEKKSYQITSTDPIAASREYTMIMAYDAGSSH